jgi:phosphoribosylaminoimidazolecarboxamide formyltransferase / IMP cyclohydrolase
MKHKALFSLNDTSRAVEFADILISAGWEVVGSNETVEVLTAANLSVTNIADFTKVKEDFGFPPSLHPKIEFALTADCENRIDLVFVLTYSLSEGNDVGGHTILALAAKGGRIPVTSNEDMEVVVKEIAKDGDLSQPLRNELITRANFENAKHYASLLKNQDGYEVLPGTKSYNLLNGENPYQVPASAFVSNRDDPLSLLSFAKVSGENPCFTNMADADCILQTLCLAVEAFQLNMRRMPFICIAAKHGNACGMGVSFESPESATETALWGNPRSIWGGEVITNFSIDESLAEALLKNSKRKECFDSEFWSLDIIVAPSFSKDAIGVLGKRKTRKLFENYSLANPSKSTKKNVLRPVRGGFLRQPSADFVLNLKECSNISIDDLTDNKIISIIIAWVVAFTSNHGGNEVAISKDNGLLGAGGGPSTLEAVSTAIKRALECSHNCANSVFAADAFFPFADVPELLKHAGCTEGVVPGGGKRFEDIKKYFSENNITCGFIPEDYRGFCRH